MHRLDVVKGQHVGPVVGCHMNEEWACFIGEKFVNSIVSNRGVRLRCKVIEICLKGGRRNIELTREKECDDGEKNHDIRRSLLELRRSLGQAFLKAPRIHEPPRQRWHKKKQGFLLSSLPSLQ